MRLQYDNINIVYLAKMQCYKIYIMNNFIKNIFLIVVIDYIYIILNWYNYTIDFMKIILSINILKFIKPNFVVNCVQSQIKEKIIILTTLIQNRINNQIKIEMKFTNSN